MISWNCCAIPLQHLDLKCIRSLRCPIYGLWVMGYMWANCAHGIPPGNLMLVIEITNECIHVVAAVVLGILLDLKICMCMYVHVHALAKGLSATLHPPQLRVFSGSGTRLCLTCVEQTAMIRQDRSYGCLSGTDGLVKKDEKATKTKYKNKFKWSIKNQLIRPKFLPKTLAFHRLEHHYSPCCHSNDRLVDFHHHTLNLPVMPVK